MDLGETRIESTTPPPPPPSRSGLEKTRLVNKGFIIWPRRELSLRNERGKSRARIANQNTWFRCMVITTRRGCRKKGFSGIGYSLFWRGKAGAGGGGWRVENELGNEASFLPWMVICFVPFQTTPRACRQTLEGAISIWPPISLTLASPAE